MPVAAWIDQNWFSVLQTLGIVGALAFTAVTLRTDTKIRRVQNHFAITEQHRKIWSLAIQYPDLFRILDPKRDLTVEPVTPSEDVFVGFLIQNLNSSFVATNSDLFVSPEKLSRDIREFLSLPVPRKVWEELKKAQNDDLVTFVEASKKDA